MAEGRGDYGKRDDYGRKFGGGGGDAKLFARPITSEADDTPATHASGTDGWFQPEYGEKHANAGDPKGSPKEARAKTTCNAGNLCLLERIDGDWYAVEFCP